MRTNTIFWVRRRLSGLFPTSSIGAYLVVMTAVVTIPLIFFAGILMLRLENNEREILRNEAVEDARSISRNIERRLQEMATTLNLLSQFPELENGDLQGFHKRVSGSLAERGMYVIAAKKDGTQLMNSRRPFDSQLLKVPPEANIAAAIETNRVAVSNIFYGNTGRDWVFNVILPLPPQLAAAGDVLIVTQNARDLSSMLSSDGVPQGWHAAVLDGAGRVIAASDPDRDKIGEAFKPPAVMSQMSSFSGTYIDDQNNIYGYAQLPGWSWKTVVWGPTERSESALTSTWRQMMVGSLVLVSTALFGAYIVGRQLRGSVQQLAAVAERIGQGEIVPPIDTKITEMNQVSVALSNASFDRSQAEDRTHLMLHEMVHRSKNMLTLVQAMMRQLGKETTSIADYQKEVDHRLRGLAMSISALSEVQWQGLPMRKLIKSHLDVFGSIAEQVRMEGNDFMLSPEAAQNFGLILHELTTNAIKYGALSEKSGVVFVRWERDSLDDHERLTVEWSEREGPAIAPPDRKGFGSTIITRHAESAFSAIVTTEYTQNGFIWKMSAPSRHFLQKPPEASQ